MADHDAMIGRALAGGGRPWTATSPRAAALRVEKALGLEGARAARVIGVPASTFRDWKAGRTKHVTSRMIAALRRTTLTDTRDAKLIAAGRKFTIKAEVEISNSTHTQVMHLGATLMDTNATESPENPAETLLDAYLTGRPGTMTLELDRMVGKYVPGMRIKKLIAVWPFGAPSKGVKR